MIELMVVGVQIRLEALVQLVFRTNHPPAGMKCTS